MPRTVSQNHASYVNDRAWELEMCKTARAMGNKMGLRSIQGRALFAREKSGIGRPRCRLTARPLTKAEQSFYGIN